ncbi:MAG: DegT/DnrJ/EryC1/StrS family aminotransferase [Granulosicoccus sp.]
MAIVAPVPMVDLRQQYLSLKDEIDQSLADVLSKTHFIMGDNVTAFENEVAEYFDCQYAVSCANGTDALHLALLALGLGPGDEIITTPFTFIATVEAIAYVGATPVFVDIDPHTYNMDTSLIEAAITERTRALLPVHIFGMPIDMTRIRQIADKHKLRIVEDCAQSFGASCDGQQTGTLGDIGCFSFFPSKNLGAFGDGGMLSTNDDELADKLRILRSHGSAARYHHSVIGYNSRLDEMQAAILRRKLPHIDHYNQQRLRAARHYCEHLANLPVQLPPLETPPNHAAVTPVFHQFTILTEQRDEIQKALGEQQIASAIYYPIPLHQQEAIRSLLTQENTYPISEDLSQRCLSLPIFPEMTDATIDRICNIIRDVLS